MQFVWRLWVHCNATSALHSTLPQWSAACWQWPGSDSRCTTCFSHTWLVSNYNMQQLCSNCTINTNKMVILFVKVFDSWWSNNNNNNNNSSGVQYGERYEAWAGSERIPTYLVQIWEKTITFHSQKCIIIIILTIFIIKQIRNQILWYERPFWKMKLWSPKVRKCSMTLFFSCSHWICTFPL